MSATATAPSAASADEEHSDFSMKDPRFGMRAKMLTAFLIALTILFGFFAWFIVDYVGKRPKTASSSNCRTTQRVALGQYSVHESE